MRLFSTVGCLGSLFGLPSDGPTTRLEHFRESTGTEGACPRRHFSQHAPPLFAAMSRVSHAAFLLLASLALAATQPAVVTDVDFSPSTERPEGLVGQWIGRYVAAGGDVSADPLPDEAFGALGARGEVDVGDNRGLRGGERERGEEEESGVGDARHGGEKWRRVLRKVAAGARAFRSGTFSEVF